MDRFTTSAASADEPVIVSQSQEVDAVDEDNACEVTLSECRPKVGGRSFVWKQKLFLVDKNSRAVCGHCGDVVPARDGNTSNLVAHYESPRVVDPDGHKSSVRASCLQTRRSSKHKGVVYGGSILR